MTKERSSFTGKIGFVMAAAGSAVGLGNIWRFPYLAAKYGGGIFLLVYLILAVTFGFALMVAEIAIGRKTGKSPFEAYKSLNPKWAFLGKLTTIVPIIIFPYYCVIGGWVMKYTVIFFKGQLEAAAGAGYFGSYIAQPVEPVVWLAVFILITALVVIMGVQKGIEKASKFMMPVLAVLAVVIALFVVCRPEAIEGLKFYLLPDFSKFSVMTVLGAMGQLFYSMSLAMGIMITYGSYMKKKESIESCVKQIEVFDFGIAFIAGLMVIPAVFAFGDGNVKAGPGLMFEVLPRVFNNMSLGSVVGAAFFFLVLMAALTSSISLMETIVSVLQDRLRWNRVVSCVVTTLFAIAVGIPSSLGFGVWSNVKPLNMSILDFFDFASNSVIMPIVALLTCIFIGHVTGTKLVSDEVESSGTFKRKKMFEVLIRYVAPVIIILILLSSVANGMGWIVI
ncbi:MAG: sodium-dependent transporter [Firmicutes bacterium]|nr:sodium-dependent transporter [Bacillota bacterium]